MTCVLEGQRQVNLQAYWPVSLMGLVSSRFSEGFYLNKIRWRAAEEDTDINVSGLHVHTHTHTHACTHLHKHVHILYTDMHPICTLLMHFLERGRQHCCPEHARISEEMGLCTHQAHLSGGNEARDTD